MFNDDRIQDVKARIINHRDGSYDVRLYTKDGLQIMNIAGNNNPEFGAGVIFIGTKNKSPIQNLDLIAGWPLFPIYHTHDGFKIFYMVAFNFDDEFSNQINKTNTDPGDKDPRNVYTLENAYKNVFESHRGEKISRHDVENIVIRNVGGDIITFACYFGKYLGCFPIGSTIRNHGESPEFDTLIRYTSFSNIRNDAKPGKFPRYFISVQQSGLMFNEDSGEGATADMPFSFPPDYLAHLLVGDKDSRYNVDMVIDNELRDWLLDNTLLPWGDYEDVFDYVSKKFDITEPDR